MTRFFRTFFSNFARSFSGPFLLGHLAAIVLTYLLVIFGFDWWYFFAVRSELLNVIFFPAIVIGGLLAIFLPLVLLLIGKIRGKEKVTFIGWTLGQAALLGWVVSSTYKSLTGRIQPDLHNLLTDISGQFQFGFWEHGIFWGWPSSHTTVAFAMAITALFLFPKNKWIKYGSLAYALYVGVGVSLSIHWFSEFVAGAIIGSLIGLAVGRGSKATLLKL